MSKYAKRTMDAMPKKHGPLPASWTFGDEIDWTSPLEEVLLHVELPFWLMIPEGEVKILWSAHEFTVTINQWQMETFLDFFTDSRQTRLMEGPLMRKFIMEPKLLLKFSTKQKRTHFIRPCKTICRPNFVR